MPDSLSGEHLTDEEALDVVLGYVPETESERIDTHLQSCADCVKTIDQLSLAHRKWSEPEGQKRLSRLRDTILYELAKKGDDPRINTDSKYPIPDLPQFSNNYSEIFGMDDGLRQSLDGQVEYDDLGRITENSVRDNEILRLPSLINHKGNSPFRTDGKIFNSSINWTYEEDVDNNLSISFNSEQVAAEGECLLLRVGDWSKKVILRRSNRDRLEGTITISEKERNMFVSGAKLEICFTVKD